MNGLDKITGRIISEAQSQADEIIKKAEKKCLDITAEYEEKATDIKNRLVAKAKREGENIVLRAESSASMSKRNIILENKAKMVDRVFKEAYDEILNLPTDKYAEFLSGLLANALKEQIDSEKESLELYGEEDAQTFDAYEVILNKKDKELFASQLIENLRRRVVGKFDSSVIDKVFVSDKTADIDGGLILKYGDIESNCSLELIFKQVRIEKEAEVNATLFQK